jgi:hypothetical protein
MSLGCRTGARGNSRCHSIAHRSGLTCESGTELSQPLTADAKCAAPAEGRSSRKTSASERWSARPATNHDPYTGSRTGIIAPVVAPVLRNTVVRNTVNRLARMGMMVTPRWVLSVPIAVVVAIAIVGIWDKNPTAVPIMNSVSSHDHASVVRYPPRRICDCRLVHRC